MSEKTLQVLQCKLCPLASLPVSLCLPPFIHDLLGIIVERVSDWHFIRDHNSCVFMVLGTVIVFQGLCLSLRLLDDEQ